MSERSEGSLGTLRCAVGLGVISCALLLLEVMTTRLLSFISWHHFGFMVVSLAMLGLGASGTMVAVSRKLKTVELSRITVVGSWLFAFFVVLGFLMVRWARFSPPMLFSAPLNQLFRLFVTSLGMILPFFAGGLVITSCLSRKGERAGVLYGGDLLGAGLGAAAGVFLAGIFSIEQGVLLSGVMGAVGAALFAWPNRRRLISSSVIIVIVATGCYYAPPIWPARGKALHRLLRELEPQGRLLSTHNTPLGRIDVVEADEIAGWSFNPAAPLKRPTEQLHILIDGEADSPVTVIDRRRPEDLEYLDYLPSSLAFGVRRPEKVLILGAGGGQDVWSALRGGAQSVDAVEINPATVALMKGALLEPSGGLYARPGINLIQQEGRSYVRSTSKRYDVVAMGLVDTWAAANTGGMSLSENFLYTTDAFEDYLAVLRPGGMISVSRWIHRPPRETLRLTVLAAKALQRRGVSQPSKHIAVVSAGRVGVLIVSRDGFSAEQMAKVRREARQRRLRIQYLPDEELGPDSNAFVQLLQGPDLDEFIASYALDITPVTDDRPFFFDFNTPRGFLALLLLFDLRNAPRSGFATLFAVLVMVSFLSLLLLVVPHLMRRVKLEKSGRRFLPFFGLTGLGFMLIEIPLLQRNTLVLGHPTQAAALVLGVLLVSSGLTSIFSRRITGERRSSLRKVLFLLVFLVGLEAIFGGQLGAIFIGLPDVLRPILVGLVLVAPFGALMGLATPHGLRAVAHYRSELIPVMWATTSFASVVGSVLSVIISMQAGFTTTLILGALCYLCAALIFPRVESSDA